VSDDGRNALARPTPAEDERERPTDESVEGGRGSEGEVLDRRTRARVVEMGALLLLSGSSEPYGQCESSEVDVEKQTGVFDSFALSASLTTSRMLDVDSSGFDVVALSPARKHDSTRTLTPSPRLPHRGYFKPVSQRTHGGDTQRRTSSRSPCAACVVV
jgi:hypothetical protein